MYIKKKTSRNIWGNSWFSMIQLIEVWWMVYTQFNLSLIVDVRIGKSSNYKRTRITAILNRDLDRSLCKVCSIHKMCQTRSLLRFALPIYVLMFAQRFLAHALCDRTNKIGNYTMNGDKLRHSWDFWPPFAKSPNNSNTSSLVIMQSARET